MRKIPIATALLLSVATAAHAASAEAHRDEELTFSSGTVTIACRFNIPSRSQPLNRDSELVGFRPFKLLADALAQPGTAVLRCEYRTVGWSSGSVPHATTADSTDDALGAVRVLLERSDIQKAVIGLIGHVVRFLRLFRR